MEYGSGIRSGGNSKTIKKGNAGFPGRASENKDNTFGPPNQGFETAGIRIRDHYDFSKGVRGKFYLGNTPFEVVIDGISQKSLATIDSSMENLRNGIVSKPIDLSAFRSVSQNRWRIFVSVKRFFQRLFHGYSEVDLWNLDIRMAKFISPRLKAYADSYRNGDFMGSYPGQILNEYKDSLIQEGFTWNESEHRFIESDADIRVCSIWQDILDGMVFSMEWIANGEDLPDECYRPNPEYDPAAEMFLPNEGKVTFTMNPAYGEREIDRQALEQFESRVQTGLTNFGKYFRCLND